MDKKSGKLSRVESFLFVVSRSSLFIQSNENGDHDH